MARIASKRSWRKRWTVRVGFVKEDCWIGVYWNQKLSEWGLNTHIYVCLIPMFPIHFSSHWETV